MSSENMTSGLGKYEESKKNQTKDNKNSVKQKKPKTKKSGKGIQENPTE